MKEEVTVLHSCWGSATTWRLGVGWQGREGGEGLWMFLKNVHFVKAQSLKTQGALTGAR